MFRLFDLFDAVSRRMEGQHDFNFIDGGDTKTERLCKYPKPA